MVVRIRLANAARLCQEAVDDVGCRPQELGGLVIIAGQSSPNLACAVQARQGEFEIQHRAFQPPQHEFASLDDALLRLLLLQMLNDA